MTLTTQRITIRHSLNDLLCLNTDWYGKNHNDRISWVGIFHHLPSFHKPKTTAPKLEAHTSENFNMSFFINQLVSVKGQNESNGYSKWKKTTFCCSLHCLGIGVIKINNLTDRKCRSKPPESPTKTWESLLALVCLFWHVRARSEIWLRKSSSK